MNFTSDNWQNYNPSDYAKLTATVELTDIETALLNELKDLVYSIRGFREGTMGEIGKVYTGSISARRLDKASALIKKVDLLRKGESE